MIKRHGNKQVEFNRYFEISQSKKKEVYDINLWFFIPTSLQNDAYTTNDFFTEFTSYTRYNAPNLSLTSLNDLFNPKSPLTRLSNINHIDENFNEIEYELKSLLNILKMSCERAITTLNAMNKFSPFEAQRNLQVQILTLNDVEKKLIELSKDIPKRFSTIYNLSIEGSSLRIEKTLQTLYKKFTNSRSFLINEITKQRELRKNMHFKSIITEDEQNNSKVIYREHLIKKWSQSIMYINMETSKIQSGISHLFLGSAAALAMLITGIITIIVAKYWGNDSFYWFIAVLILYSLKDRIKDIFKSLFLKRMTTIFSDRIKSIISPINRRKCGKTKESITYPNFVDLSSDIKKLRFKLKDDISIKQYQEDIIHYNKKVKILTNKLYKNHTRLFGIREIMRLDLRRWFHKMDKDIERCYMPQNGELIKVHGDREYHFNLILQINNSDGKTLERYRVTANSRKVKSVIKIT